MTEQESEIATLSQQFSSQLQEARGNVDPQLQELRAELDRRQQDLNGKRGALEKLQGSYKNILEEIVEVETKKRHLFMLENETSRVERLVKLSSIQNRLKDEMRADAALQKEIERSQDIAERAQDKDAELRRQAVGDRSHEHLPVTRAYLDRAVFM